jgi:hypothetical protein
VFEPVIGAVGVDEPPERLVPGVELVREPGHRAVGRLADSTVTRAATRGSSAEISGLTESLIQSTASS